MSPLVVTAPGKLFLFGEYAVLTGAPAVVAAVDRRAEARPGRRVEQGSPVVRAAIQAARAAIVGFGGADPGEPRLAVTTRDMSRGRRKLGLGSSAAVAAVTVGWIFERAGLAIGLHRAAILDVARAAHRDAQGGSGSGGDLAAAVYGGTIVYSTKVAPAALIWPQDLFLAAVWTGEPSSTTSFLAGVRQLREEQPSVHDQRLGELAELSRAAVAALTAEQASTVVELAHAYGAAMDRLGQAARLPIVTPSLHAAARLAAELGGAAKPSGAGGGDVAVGFFADPEAAHRFCLRSHRIGLTPLSLTFAASGLRREDGAGTATR